VSKND